MSAILATYTRRGPFGDDESPSASCTAPGGRPSRARPSCTSRQCARPRRVERSGRDNVGDHALRGDDDSPSPLRGARRLDRATPSKVRLAKSPGPVVCRIEAVYPPRSAARPGGSGAPEEAILQRPRNSAHAPRYPSAKPRREKAHVAAAVPHAPPRRQRAAGGGTARRWRPCWQKA